jgi:hypothetical protein
MKSHRCEENGMAYVATGKFVEFREVFGNGECASLVKALTLAPADSLWREGENLGRLLAEGACVPEGTAIAIFMNGRYGQRPQGDHAAIFVRRLADGIEVYDQDRGRKPKVRMLKLGLPPASDAAQCPELYSIIV